MAENTEGRCTFGKQRFWWGLGGQVGCGIFLRELREWAYTLSIA